MAGSEQFKRQTRRTVFSITVLAVITLALVVSTLAWFVANRQVDVNSFNLSTDGAYNLQVSPTEEDDWSYDLQHVDESMRLRPVVGNGVNFFTALFTQQADEEGGSVFHSVASGYERVSPSSVANYAFTVDFKVTIEQDCPLLVENLTLQMPVESNINFETSPDGIDRSGLLGAVRLAILVNEGGTYKPCFYWMPDPQTMLTKQNGVYSLDRRSSDFEDFVLQTGATEEVRVPAPTGAGPGQVGGTGISVTSDGLQVHFGGSLYLDEVRRAVCPLGPEDNVLAQLQGRRQKSFRLVVWIDGNDNECNNVLMGGTVQVGMRLSADIQEEE